MLRSIASSIEFEKFRRNWSEKNSTQRFLIGRVNSVNAYLWVGVQGVVALSLLFAPIFLRRTHVNYNLGFKNQFIENIERSFISINLY
ncbi:hypothetical protein [Leptospira noguchii]|uniref:hypothetical protein n=1 Tax=Leptospira noguchii TaxID=28182 RepID=UPI0009E56607|nr:hypothetical protein [Leptospira noguchii]UOG49255.1 hypothetical protein MAL00_02820 [Leptospira noguchii]